MPADGTTNYTLSVKINPHWLSVEPGQPVMFDCVLSCNNAGAPCNAPPTEITWRTESGSLNPEATITNGVLNIPSARPSDEQYYYCSAATSDIASLEAQTVLFVRNRSE